MKYSAILTPLPVALIYCSVLILSACSHRSPAPSRPDALSAETDLTLKRLGVLPAVAQGQYLQQLQGRLLAALPEQPPNSPTPTMIVVNSSQPLAYSSQDGRVIVSLGLLHLSAVEAELAFVIAHELGHLLLEHEWQPRKPSIDPLGGFQEPQELAADRFAVGLIALAGYDPRAGVAAIMRLYQTSSSKTTLAAQGSTRAAALQRYLDASGWQPPGIVNTREFQRFKAGLPQLGNWPSLHN